MFGETVGLMLICVISSPHRKGRIRRLRIAGEAGARSQPAPRGFGPAARSLLHDMDQLGREQPATFRSGRGKPAGAEDDVVTDREGQGTDGARGRDGIGVIVDTHVTEAPSQPGLIETANLRVQGPAGRTKDSRHSAGRHPIAIGLRRPPPR